MQPLLLATIGLLVVQLVKPRALWAKWRARFNRGKEQLARPAEPLAHVVARCEARWFLEELKTAMEGDPEAMLRVSQMLLAGYGVKQDPQEAARWMRHVWALQNNADPTPMMEAMLSPDIHSLHSTEVKDTDVAATAEHSDSEVSSSSIGHSSRDLRKQRRRSATNPKADAQEFYQLVGCGSQALQPKLPRSRSEGSISQ